MLTLYGLMSGWLFSHYYSTNQDQWSNASTCAWGRFVSFADVWRR